MVIYEGNCIICRKYFRRRYSKNQPAPRFCSKDCYALHMKDNWRDKNYRNNMVKKHKDNPTKYWLGKKRPDMCGDKNPNWKDVKGSFLKDGYRILYLPDYVYSDKKGCILEHKKVWIDSNGEIPKGYDIHHKDEDKLNNKLSNLKMLTRSEHMKIHCSFNSLVL